MIRAYLNSSRPPNLGATVMLGTPNQGSQVADFLKDRWIYKRLFGPAGQQLVTEFESAEMLFGQIDYDLGIIAGSRTIDPISSLIIGVPNDGKVSVENTEVLGMTDHVIVSVTHAFLPYRRIVHHLVLQFRRSARFEC